MKPPILRHQIFLLLALCLAAIWISTLVELSRSKDSALREAESATLFQAQVFAEHSLSTIKRLDELLLDMRDYWDGNTEQFAERVERRQNILSDIALQVAIIGPDGMMAFSNLSKPSAKVDLSERQHFRVHQESGNKDQLFISNPLLGKVSGKWSIQFTRPILRTGAFAGVIVVSVSPDVFAGFHRHLKLGPEGSATITRDGEILARQPEGDKHYGKKLSGSAFEQPDSEGSGTFVKWAQTDGIERLYGYYKLPEYRMNFVVGEAMKNILRPHEQHRNVVLLAANAASLMVILLSGMILRSQRAREKAMLALRSSEARYRQFFEMNRAIKLAIAAKDGRIADANRAALDFYGYRREEFLALSVADISSLSSDEIHQQLAEIQQGLRPYLTDRHRLAGGEMRDVEIYSGPGDIDGQPMIFSIIHDITERKRIETESRLLGEAVAQSNASVVMTNAAGEISFVNDAFERNTGYRRTEALGNNPRFLKSGETAAAVYQQLWQTITSGQTWHGELCNRRKDGQLIWDLTSISPVTGSDGTITHFICVQDDISQRKLHEEEMRSAKLAAEMANIAKSQFLATMSHEIRTPLNGILGMAQILLMPDLQPEEKQDAARTILNSGQTLLTLLNDILDLSKIEAGKLELSEQAFSPARLIHDTDMLFRESAKSRGLVVESRWEGDAEQRFWSDPIRIRQMLSNLVSNAIKFTDQGTVRIEGRAQFDAAGKATLRFTVTDTGIGIDPERQHSLFQPFSQVDNSSTRRFQGTGLGLSIIRHLAEQMGGQAGMESTLGEGSCFWFEISSRPVGREEESRRSERQAILPDIAAEAPPRRILIVEDNPTNRKVLESILRKHRVAFDSVGDGAEAVRIVTGGEHAPELILMDCQMPVMDGFEATRQIRDWEARLGRPACRIIALTAAAYEEDRKLCREAGMDDFLAKPIDVRALLVKLGIANPGT